MLAVLPSGGEGILTIAIAIALWLLVGFASWKQRSLRTWIVAGIIVALMVVGVSLLPVRAPALLARLGVGFLLFKVLVYVLVRMASAALIHLARKALVDLEEARGAERVDLPPSLEPDWKAFVELGFEPVATVRLTKGSVKGVVIAHLVRVEDGIIAVVAVGPRRRDPPIVQALNSTLSGRIGSLVTMTWTKGLAPRLWPGELRQVFRGASANHLLENHLIALDFLKGRGIESDELRVDEVLEVEDEMLGRAKHFAAKVPTRALGRELKRQGLGPNAAVGALATLEDIEEQINAFFDLRAHEGPGGLTEPRPD